MSSQTLDILAINETRLDSTIADKDIAIIGYNVVRKDRNRHGGGVLFYVKETWNFLTKQITSNIDLEILTIEIIGKFVKTIPGYYLVQTSASELNVLDTFETYLQSLEMEEKESIILGDFNCNILEINKLHIHQNLLLYMMNISILSLLNNLQVLQAVRKL